MTKRVCLSIIVPAFNEEKRLPSTLTASIDYLKRQRYSYEIIVVNDGSVDENSDMSSISNWDSLSHISVILAIEKETGLSLTPKEIAQSTSVENIYNIVNNMK